MPIDTNTIELKKSRTYPWGIEYRYYCEDTLGNAHPFTLSFKVTPSSTGLQNAINTRITSLSDLIDNPPPEEEITPDPELKTIEEGIKSRIENTNISREDIYKFLWWLVKNKTTISQLKTWWQEYNQ